MTLDALGALRPEEVAPLLGDAEPRLRELAAGAAERFVRDDPRLADAVAALASDDDPLVRSRAALTIAIVPGEGGLERMARFLATGRGGGHLRELSTGLSGHALDFARLLRSRNVDRLDDLAELIGYEGRPGDFRRFIDLIWETSISPGGFRRQPEPRLFRVFVAAERGRRRAGGSLRELLRSEGDDRRDELRRRAAAIADDPTLGPGQRAEAIRFLSFDPRDTDLDLLAARLRPIEPPEVQLEAVRALIARDSDPAASRLLAAWDRLGTSSRREAVEALLRRPERAGLLLDAIADGIVPRGDLDRIRRAQLLASPDEVVRERARSLLGDGVDRTALIDRYRREMPAEGSAARGQGIAMQYCTTCHSSGREGTSIAPDLATVAGRSRDDLLTHILDPNREVTPALVVQAVATRDGRTFTGILARETDTMIVLRREGDAQDEIPRSEVDAIRSTGLSLMPEGLEAQIDPEAMADLIAYIQQPPRLDARP
jgi:putative heme-binding domain-containing protein